MNTLEKQMVSLLRRMREECHLVGVKGEFEAEGARQGELLRLREISGRAGVEMVVKIGGCEAITDMRMARSIGAEQIVAPMVESPFAVQKYLNAARLVFREDELDELGLLINVETLDGVRNFDAICALPGSAGLSGVDIGRVDLAGSMGLSAEGCNSPRVFDACRSLCGRWKSAFPDKGCTVGGLLSPRTIRFLEALPEELSVGCESKKTVFGPGAVRGGLRAAFSLAVDFERLWYQSCMEDYRWLSGKNWAYFEALPDGRAFLES